MTPRRRSRTLARSGAPPAASPARPAGPARATRADAAPATVRLGLFTRSLATLAALARGCYARHGLTVQEHQVASSTQQFQALRDGAYDVVLTSSDNVVNYRLNAGNPAGGRIDVQIFMGADHGMNLSLVARPGVTAVEALRGKTVAVDAPASGFAFVLYRILRARGLERGRDYDVVPAGGTPDRYRALIAGRFDATLLSGGFESRAAGRGHRLLASVRDVADPYLGTVGAARAGWLEQHRDVAIRLLRAYCEGLGWALDPASRDEAIALLMTQPDTPRPVAEQIYGMQLRRGVGMIPDAGVDPMGLLTVLKLREEFGGFEQPQDLEALSSPAGGLYDRSYARAALR